MRCQSKRCTNFFHGLEGAKSSSYKIWRDPFFRTANPGPCFCQDRLISVYSGRLHCVLLLRPCISFPASPFCFGLLLEKKRTHCVRAEAGIRNASFTPSWSWANSGKMSGEGLSGTIIAQLILMHNQKRDRKKFQNEPKKLLTSTAYKKQCKSRKIQRVMC